MDNTSLHEFCWEDGYIFCPRCSNKNIYMLKGDRYRCSHCKYSFHDFSGRWLNYCSLDHNSWEEIIKYYISGWSAASIARSLNLSYNLAHKSLKVIRSSLLIRDETFIPLLENPLKIRTYCSMAEGDARFKHCLGENAPVFSVRYAGTGVKVGYVPSLNVKEVLFMQTRKRFCRSMFVCDYPGENGYLLFSCCAYLRKKTRCDNFLDHRRSLEAESSFWTMCFEMLDRYHKFSPESFPLYLKEFEARHEHGLSSLKALISKSICSFVPDLKH